MLLNGRDKLGDELLGVGDLAGFIACDDDFVEFDMREGVVFEGGRRDAFFEFAEEGVSGGFLLFRGHLVGGDLQFGLNLAEFSGIGLLEGGAEHLESGIRGEWLIVLIGDEDEIGVRGEGGIHREGRERIELGIFPDEGERRIFDGDEGKSGDGDECFEGEVGECVREHDRNGREVGGMLTELTKFAETI